MKYIRWCQYISCFCHWNWWQRWRLIVNNVKKRKDIVLPYVSFLKITYNFFSATKVAWSHLNMLKREMFPKIFLTHHWHCSNNFLQIFISFTNWNSDVKQNPQCICKEQYISRGNARLYHCSLRRAVDSQTYWQKTSYWIHCSFKWQHK